MWRVLLNYERVSRFFFNEQTKFLKQDARIDENLVFKRLCCLKDRAFFSALEQLEKLLRALVVFVERMKSLNLTLADVFQNFMILLENVRAVGLPKERL